MKAYDFMAICDFALSTLDTGGFINFRSRETKEAFLSAVYGYASSVTNIISRADSIIYFPTRFDMYEPAIPGKYETAKFNLAVKKAWQEITKNIPESTISIDLPPADSRNVLEKVFGRGIIDFPPFTGYVLKRNETEFGVDEHVVSATYHRLMKRRGDVPKLRETK